MHPHHKLALDKARLQFRQARCKMNREVKAVNTLREFMVIRELDSHYHLGVLKYQMRRAVAAIEEYRAQGEVLSCVERMLEKA